eukprot:1159713-Pelagomonas_calceolata.AAC.7
MATCNLLFHGRSSQLARLVWFGYEHASLLQLSCPHRQVQLCNPSLSFLQPARCLCASVRCVPSASGCMCASVRCVPSASGCLCASVRCVPSASGSSGCMCASVRCVPTLQEAVSAFYADLRAHASKHFGAVSSSVAFKALPARQQQQLMADLQQLMDPAAAGATAAAAANYG